MHRRLGRSDLLTSPMGLGCWAIGGPYTNAEGKAVGWSRVDDDESRRAVRRALDLGVTFFDTAACYGCGHSEEVLGQALEGVMGEVLIATKFWHTFDEQARVTRGSYAGPDEIAAGLEGSLRRLGRDWIDLYQFHQGNYPREEAPAVVEALERLVEAGKIRWYGWSTDDPHRAAVFARGPHCTSVQHRLNVLQRADEMLTLCDAKDLASINKGPLIKGLLTGKFTRETTFPDDDVRHSYWDLASGHEAELLERYGRVREALTADGRTPAQGALGWIWAHNDRTIPIPGFKTVAQVEDNAGAIERGPLSQEQMAEIESILCGE